MSSNTQSSNTISTVALERELSQITNINNTLDNLLRTIQKVNSDLNLISNATTNSRILMNKWTDIMSQTDFTLDAINNNAWSPRNLEKDPSDNEYSNSDDDEDEEKEKALEEKLHQLEQKNSELSRTIESLAEEKNSRINKRKRDAIGGGGSVGNGFNSRRKLLK